MENLSGLIIKLHDQKRECKPVEPTKLVGETSKHCPHDSCNRRRKRDYTIVGPLSRDQCNRDLEVRNARISSTHAWWNVGIVRWLIAPPDPSCKCEWYECWTHATCPIHGRELVKDLCYIRQFGRIRRWLIWVRGHIIHTINLIIQIH